MNGLIIVIILVAAVLIKNMKFRDTQKICEFFTYSMLYHFILKEVFILISRYFNEVLDTDTKISIKKTQLILIN